MRRAALPIALLACSCSLFACGDAAGDDDGEDVGTDAPESDASSTDGPEAGTIDASADAPDSSDATGSDASSSDSSSSDSADAPTDGSSDSTGVPGCEVADLIDQALWDQIFLHKNDPACAGTIYTWQGLVDAAADYPSFACEGDEATRRRELAAFLAQISHETTGGWADAPDGPYSWGLCFIEEVGCENNACPQYCDPNNLMYPCAPGKTYHGRGAIQLSWNYNYGQAGDALGVDLLSDPDLVKSDSKLAIQTAMWFWMTTQAPKPSAHDVIVGNWQPSAQDQTLGRLPGFGMTTNIINGGLECNMPGNSKVADRVGFFERYVELLGTDVGDNVWCDMMTPY